MNNDLVSRFKEKTEKHWHPFMGVKTKLEKKGQLVNDDQRDLIDVFRETFAGVMTVEDTMRLTLRLYKQVNDASDEIETLRNKLAEQEIIHAVQKKNTMTEIERLRAEVAYLKTPCPRCDYEESDG